MFSYAWVGKRSMGRDSMKYAGVCAKRLGAKKIFFVSDPGLENTGWVDEIGRAHV